MKLHDAEDHRKYMTADDRAFSLAAAEQAPQETKTFCLVLADRIDLEAEMVIFESLKKNGIRGSIAPCRRPPAFWTPWPRARCQGHSATHSSPQSPLVVPEPERQPDAVSRPSCGTLGSTALRRSRTDCDTIPAGGERRCPAQHGSKVAGPCAAQHDSDPCGCRRGR